MTDREKHLAPVQDSYHEGKPFLGIGFLPAIGITVLCMGVILFVSWWVGFLLLVGLLTGGLAFTKDESKQIPLFLNDRLLPVRYEPSKFYTKQEQRVQGLKQRLRKVFHV